MKIPVFFRKLWALLWLLWAVPPSREEPRSTAPSVPGTCGATALCFAGPLFLRRSGAQVPRFLDSWVPGSMDSSVRWFAIARK